MTFTVTSAYGVQKSFDFWIASYTCYFENRTLDSVVFYENHHNQMETNLVYAFEEEPPGTDIACRRDYGLTIDDVAYSETLHPWITVTDSHRQNFDVKWDTTEYFKDGGYTISRTFRGKAESFTLLVCRMQFPDPLLVTPADAIFKFIMDPLTANTASTSTVTLNNAQMKPLSTG